jgi:hypothetical protein
MSDTFDMQIRDGDLCFLDAFLSYQAESKILPKILTCAEIVFSMQEAGNLDARYSGQINLDGLAALAPCDMKSVLDFCASLQRVNAGQNNEPLKKNTDAESESFVKRAENTHADLESFIECADFSYTELLMDDNFVPNQGEEFEADDTFKTKETQVRKDLQKLSLRVDLQNHIYAWPAGV